MKTNRIYHVTLNPDAITLKRGGQLRANVNLAVIRHDGIRF